MSEHGSPAIIVDVDGTNVLVAIPLTGFPPGFQVKPGQRIMVMIEGSGLTARPIVDVHHVTDSSADMVNNGTVVINNETHEVQADAAHDDPAHTGSAVVAVMDHGNASGPKQVFGTRPQ